jgi:hypothetical protein
MKDFRKQIIANDVIKKIVAKVNLSAPGLDRLIFQIQP